MMLERICQEEAHLLETLEHIGRHYNITPHEIHTIYDGLMKQFPLEAQGVECPEAYLARYQVNNMLLQNWFEAYCQKRIK